MEWSSTVSSSLPPPPPSFSVSSKLETIASSACFWPNIVFDFFHLKRNYFWQIWRETHRNGRSMRQKKRISKANKPLPSKKTKAEKLKFPRSKATVKKPTPNKQKEQKRKRRRKKKTQLSLSHIPCCFDESFSWTQISADYKNKRHDATPLFQQIWLQKAEEREWRSWRILHSKNWRRIQSLTNKGLAINASPEIIALITKL